MNRVCDALRDVEAASRAQKHEQRHPEQDAAIDVADLALDVALSRRQRNGQNGIGADGSDRRRRDQIVLRAERVLGHERRCLRQRDRVVHTGRRTGRQQARGEQVAFAGRDQPRAFEDVDILFDDLADEHQEIVGHEGRGRVGRLLQLRDDALGDDGGSGGAGLHVGAELGGGVVANEHGQAEHGNCRYRNEGQKETAVEADAQLADQLAAEAVPSRRERADERQDDDPHAERGAGPGRRSRQA